METARVLGNNIKLLLNQKNIKRDAFANEKVEVFSLDLKTKEIIVKTDKSSEKIIEILDEAGYDAKI